MPRHAFPLALVLALAVAACDGPPLPDDGADPVAVRATIDSLNVKLEAWYAAGEIDSVASVFAEDVWQMPPYSPALVGRDSLRAFWRTASEWGRWTFDLESQDVVVSDSIAVERGRYSLTFTASAGAPIPSMRDEGNYVVLWRRESDGHWRIVWDAPVSHLPPPGAPGAAGATPAGAGAGG